MAMRLRISAAALRLRRLDERVEAQRQDERAGLPAAVAEHEREHDLAIAAAHGLADRHDAEVVPDAHAPRPLDLAGRGRRGLPADLELARALGLGGRRRRLELGRLEVGRLQLGLLELGLLEDRALLAPGGARRD